MKKTIGVLAHVDAGKTTFAEQILYHTNSIRKYGRVDHRDAFLDSHSIEKERGITVFSDQGLFEFNDSTYYLVDTPGHIDFSTEMERAILIMDYAVILISAVEGIQAHTKTVWRLLRKYNVPTMFFINKLDRGGADEGRVFKELKKELTKDVFYVESDVTHGCINFNSELIEFVSEYDDELLEMYLDGYYDESLWKRKFKKLIKNNNIFPCFKGSALQDDGIAEFLCGLDEITYTQYNAETNNEGINKFIGYVYKIRHEKNGNRITFIKCLNGKLNVKDEINYGNNEENEIVEKVNGIRVYNGSKFKTIDTAKCGDLVGITGITRAVCGETLGTLKNKFNYEMTPTLMAKVIFDKSYNIKDILSYFKLLEAEDPELNVIWNEVLSEMHVHIMGKIQLEVLKEIVKERFSLEVEFGPCKILYKESILKPTIGCGHFEPLRHYSEVHLKLEPALRNSGITFENACHVDNLLCGYQNLVKTHIFEREHHGLLTGSTITDIKVTLLNGRAHLKHTCGGDFREATFRALRQGLEKVPNVLLEPYYMFKIEVEQKHIGRVIGDIQRLSGSFESPKNINGKVIINGRGPVSTFMDYSLEVLAFTNGKGNVNLVYDGYDVCHNSEEVIEKIGYKKNEDIEYTSSSIFCCHGKSNIKKWHEADEAMHVELIQK